MGASFFVGKRGRKCCIEPSMRQRQPLTGTTAGSIPHKILTLAGSHKAPPFRSFRIVLFLDETRITGLIRTTLRNTFKFRVVSCTSIDGQYVLLNGDNGNGNGGINDQNIHLVNSPLYIEQVATIRRT